MKQTLLLLLMILLTMLLSMTGFCQIIPSFSSYFSWGDRFGSQDVFDDYISPAKDQKAQGPCFVFSSVAAVEAMCHIYSHKPFSASATSGVLDLAEAEIYLCYPLSTSFFNLMLKNIAFAWNFS